METITKPENEKAFGSWDSSLPASGCLWEQGVPGFLGSLGQMITYQSQPSGSAISPRTRTPRERREKGPLGNPPHPFPEDRRQREPAMGSPKAHVHGRHSTVNMRTRTSYFLETVQEGGKNLNFGVRQNRGHVISPPLSSFLILGNLMSPSEPRFLEKMHCSTPRKALMLIEINLTASESSPQRGLSWNPSPN